MNDLNKLKQTLLGVKASEQEQIYSLCQIMEICGGYEQLMNLPLSSLKHIGKYLEKVNKEMQKGMKMPGMRKR